VGTLMIYDEMHEVSGWLTSNISASGTSAVVEDATDFEAGETGRLYDMSTPFTWEDVTISAVDLSTNTLTISATTSAYTATEDRIVMRKKFVPDTKFIMFTDTMEGEKIAEFMNAPFGNDRHWGMFTDTKEEWDPEGIWVRTQNKGLPVMYHPDAVYTMTVAG